MSMTKAEILATVMELDQADSVLEDDEFLTGDYATETGMTRDGARKRLRSMEARGLLSSRPIRNGSTRTNAWKIAKPKGAKK